MAIERAVILAAGRGSRLAPLTDDRPKCLVEFEGVPLLKWQIMALEEAGISDIVIVTGYRSEMIGNEYRTIQNKKWKITNMVESMFSFSKVIDKPVIVSYSDIIYDSSAITVLMKSKKSIGVLYHQNWWEIWSARFEKPLSDLETFVLRQDNSVAEIGRTTTDINQIDGQYMGLIRIGPADWQELRSLYLERKNVGDETMDVTTLLDRAINMGKRVYGVAFDGAWGEIDRVEDLALYENDQRFESLRKALAAMRERST